LGLAFFAPNTFTPNGDGINDVFVVNMFTVISYKIQIFNRYGVPLFISNDLNNHWDGTFNGEQLPVGTYYYIINAIDLNGESIQKSGSITIVR
jgi:gliding motility-associated-like protein